ncbi:alkaline shock response membrane anchor protein AmaP [Candidatus Acetothermia bacterium]|nr:alkaline shock response membrane anchor protein AmaP [Candidatus Acetothermia bacterium]MCI2431454.1 alkaline shock response membrane anchor protein AmaP [Candidatus Acetothermia bacterium]MCI2437126.1 alkaline shock response membrane anchor protein AmaP [Candidatus Acetothermia bacterium]
MKRTSDSLIELLYLGAFLASWVGVTVLLLLAFRAIEWKFLLELLYNDNNIWVIVLLDLFAAVFFLMGIYFLAQLIQRRRRWRHIQHESPRGPVEISLFAIRSYIEKLLQQDFGLARFRVALEKKGDGLEVLVRAELPVGDNVLSTAERIQKSIEESVEDRVGVKVRRVQIIAAGIVAKASEEKPLFQGELE